MAAKRKPDRSNWPIGLREPRPGYFAFDYEGTTRGIGRVSFDEAVAIAEDMMDRFKSAAVFAEVASRDRALSAMRDRTYHSACSRAKRFGREMMSRGEFDVLWARSGGRCELTGIAFSAKPDGSSERIWPWHSSLDRIDNGQGYTFENSRIVCVAMNLALHEFGEDVFRIIAKCYNDVRWRPKTAQEPHA